MQKPRAEFTANAAKRLRHLATIFRKNISVDLNHIYTGMTEEFQNLSQTDLLGGPDQRQPCAAGSEDGGPFERHLRKIPLEEPQSATGPHLSRTPLAGGMPQVQQLLQILLDTYPANSYIPALPWTEVRAFAEMILV